METVKAFIILLICCTGISAKSCLAEVQKLQETWPPLMGAFTPTCQPNGLYTEMQQHEGFYFCVIPETGEEIQGTRQDKRLVKPKSCKATTCVLVRHKALLGSSQGLVGQFKPKCDENGDFSKVQCHASTGYCYCVSTKTGVKILGTEIRGTPDCDKPVGKCLEQVKSLESNPPMLGAYKPVCQSNGMFAEMQNLEGFYFCVIPETGEEILGTRQDKRLVKPKLCKATPCMMQRHYGLLKSSKNIVGHFTPQCEEDGSFKKVQCHGSTGYCFCVVPETGKRIQSTAVRGQPTNCELAGKDNGKTCLQQVAEVEGKQPMLGAFKPECQPNGLFAETQCHGSTGYCYCVIPKTGEEILGTRVRFTKPKTCKATACFMQRHNAMLDAKKGMTGQFQPECEDDGSFSKTQCHSSTGYCFCYFPDSGEKVLGTEVRFSKPKNCELTECMRQRHEAMKTNLLGVFKPECDENGIYKPKQCKEGICYCVFPKTGEEILGTRLVRGQTPVSCEITKCVQERHNFLTSPKDGINKPQCTEKGLYEPIQCHEKYCYCVFPKSGKQVLGTMIKDTKPKSCNLTPCVLARHKGWSMTMKGLLGVPSPRCDADGKYQKVQCNNGWCWCANTDTGKALAGATWSRSIPTCP